MERDEADGGLEDGTEAGLRRPGGGEAQSDDLELVQRLRDDDPDALRVLMGRYDRLVRYAVFRTCRAECTRDPAFLDSRASEAWTGFVRSVQRPESAPPANLKTYLIQIAKNKCADALRRPEPAAFEQTGSLGDELSGVEAPTTASVELLIQAEEVLALQVCIERLSASDKRIYSQVEHLVAGRWKAAAQALRMPESTLRSRWSAIVARLRACLARKKPKNLAPPPEGSDS